MSPKFAKSHFDTPNAPFKDFLMLTKNERRTTYMSYILLFNDASMYF